MLNKHLVFLVLMMIAIFNANAVTWKIHSSYCSTAAKMQNIFDTGDKVYYLNSGNLFQFDKATSTLVALNKQNMLSDYIISQIYYDWEYNLLFIAYTNSNIDIIDGNGKVTNINSVKNKVMSLHNYVISYDDNGSNTTTYTGKEIRDINFGKGKAYVAVGYGFLIIDEEKLEIEKEVLIKQTVTVNSVAMMGDTLLLFSKNRCYYGPPGEPDPIANYQSYTGAFSNQKMYPIDNQSVFVYGTANGLYRLVFTNGTPKLTKINSYQAINIQKAPAGFIVNYSENSYSVFNAAGTTGTSVTSTVSRGSSHPLGDGTIWVTDANGLHTNGSTAYYKINVLTTDAPYWLKYNAELDKLYAGVSGPIFNVYGAIQQSVANVINTYDGVNWTDATAYTAKGAGYEFVFDPFDQHTYLRTGWTSGIFKVTDDVRITNYTTGNALIGGYKPTPAFDNYGNLWVASSLYASANPCTVLPRDKYLKTTPAKGDWFLPTGLLHINTGSTQNSKFLVARKNNVKIFSDCDYCKGSYTGHIICWDNGVEDPTVDNYRSSSIGHFIDQNNSLIRWKYLYHFEEDKDGMIWVGHDLGLFWFDPDVVFNEVPRAVRPFTVKSIEGKGYLCEGNFVNDIGVDRENNKWIATRDNGLFFVSPDGSELYNHFTTYNSDIPSNTVYSVECDTVHDRVYIFTDNGFAEYVAHGDAAALNFDNVYAFPNPVNPDFTGMIKIGNLMENTFVTITDRNNNVIAQFGPVMGSVFWDGSGADGDRVPTGIYNIYAAQGAQPAITGTPQATVMIVK